MWLIYIPWHFPYQFDESITGASDKAEAAFKKLYPAVYEHMLQYKEPLMNRNKAETGIRYEWYALQRWGAKYWGVFVEHEHTVCDFSGSDSWVILSPIEQSIKRKIEAVGTPLKDWDINIYRGVLTGLDSAFIISSEKRDEILSKCKSEDERTRTTELIRPKLISRLNTITLHA